MKFQLTMPVNFVSCLYPKDIRTMDPKSKNIEILMGSKTDDIINELFESFLQKYQTKLEEKVISFTLFLKVLIYYIIVFTKQK